MAGTDFLKQDILNSILLIKSWGHRFAVFTLSAGLPKSKHQSFHLFVLGFKTYTTLSHRIAEHCGAALPHG